MTEKNQEPSFSLREFRSWLAKHKNPETPKKKHKSKIAESMIGKTVESRLGVVRLEQKIAESNKTKIADILARDFKEGTGVITSTNDLMVEIEVESGKFFIPKIYTKEFYDDQKQ